MAPQPNAVRGPPAELVAPRVRARCLGAGLRVGGGEAGEARSSLCFCVCVCVRESSASSQRGSVPLGVDPRCCRPLNA